MKAPGLLLLLATSAFGFNAVINARKELVVKKIAKSLCTGECNAMSRPGRMEYTSLRLSLDEPLLKQSSPMWRSMLMILIALRLTGRAIMIASESFEAPDFYAPTLPNVDVRAIGRKVSKLANPITRPIRCFFDRMSDQLHIDFFPLVRLWYRIVAAKLALAAERLYNFFNEALDLDPPDVANLEEWGVCILAEREVLPGDLFRYRFELESTNAILPLEMGQELQMCVVDSYDNVLKEPFFPVSKPTARGYFDVVTRRGGDASGDRFAEALSQMGVGDELAYKGGRYRLNYLGNNYPIEGMSIIASGFGAAPALQIVRDVFTEDSTTIDNVEMLWVNEKKSDFVCDADLEDLEYRYVERFTMSRIIQEDLYGRGLTKRYDVKNSLSPYTKGNLGVICAPEYVISKARNLLVDLGYPLADIVTIVTSA